MNNASKITSRANPLIKSLHLLKVRGKRIKSDLFICEGVKLVEEAIKSGAEIEYILISPRFDISKIKKTLVDKRLHLNIINTTDSVLEYLSETVTPQGIIAVVKKKCWTLDELLKGESGTILFLYMLQDPGNLGTIIRSAEAGGIKGIVIVKGTIDPYNPKVIRSTMGSIFRMPIVRLDSSTDFIRRAKGMGYRVVGLLAKAKVKYFEENLTIPTVLIFGQEASGLPNEINRLTDETVSIPMLGDVESLNVAVSVSIVLYEGVRQKICKSY